MKTLILKAAAVISLAVLFCLPIGAFAQQARYPTPRDAAEALVSAVQSKDQAALARVLGPKWRTLLPPDGVHNTDVAAFLDKAQNSLQVVMVDPKRAEIAVGPDQWTLPIPIIDDGKGGWYFDIKGGRKAIAERRIGLNELSAMKAMLAYVDAQREYAEADRTGDGVLQYAQRLVSSPGKRDGLIWDPSLGDESPLGLAFIPKKPGQGYHGYRFRIMTAQGPQAPGGARSYLLNGRLLTGFALIGWPVVYGKTGVMTFMVNQEGRIYQRDLGPQTAQAATKIKGYNPDANWAAAKP